MARAKFPVFMDPPENYPVGSAEWAGRVSVGLSHEFNAVDKRGMRRLIESLKEAMPGRPWLAWPPEKPWGHREIWCQMIFEVSWKRIIGLVEELYPEEARALELMVAGDDAKAIQAGGNNNPEGVNQHRRIEEVTTDDVSNDQPGRNEAHGNSSAYILRRLHKLAESNKAPEERREAAREALKGYRNGRLTTPTAAGREAGIVREPDPYGQLCRWWRNASPEQRDAFENYIGEFRQRATA